MFTKRSLRLHPFLLLVSLLIAGCAPASSSYSLAITEPTALPVNLAAGTAEPVPLDIATSTTTPLPTISATSTATPLPTIAATAEPQTPEAVVRAFYEWYLAYIGDPATDTFRNPLVDRAYRDAPYLNPSFVQHIDELLDEMRRQGGGGYDPFLCAQDIPQDFSVDPGIEDGTAVVHLQFGPQCVSHLRITMDETGRRIAAIGEDTPSVFPASVYTNSDYGFAFSYPYDWVVQE